MHFSLTQTADRTLDYYYWTLQNTDFSLDIPLADFLAVDQAHFYPKTEVKKGDYTTFIRLPQSFDTVAPVMTRSYGNNTSHRPVIIKPEQVPVHTGSLPPHNPGPYVIEDLMGRKTISDPYFFAQRRLPSTSTESLNMRMAEAASIARVDRLEDTFVGVTAQGRAALNQVTEVQMSQNDLLSAQSERIRMLEGQLQSLADHVGSLTPTASPAEDVNVIDDTPGDTNLTVPASITPRTYQRTWEEHARAIGYDPAEDCDSRAIPPDSDGDDGTGGFPVSRPSNTDYQNNYELIPPQVSRRPGIEYSLSLTDDNDPTPTEDVGSPTVDPIAVVTPVDPIAVVTPVEPTAMLSLVAPIATGHVPQYMVTPTAQVTHVSHEVNPVMEGYFPHPLQPSSPNQETGTSSHHRESLVYMDTPYGPAASTATPRRSTSQRIIGAVKDAVRTMTPRSRSATPPPPTGEKTQRCHRAGT